MRTRLEIILRGVFVGSVALAYGGLAAGFVGALSLRQSAALAFLGAIIASADAIVYLAAGWKKFSRMG